MREQRALVAEEHPRVVAIAFETALDLGRGHEPATFAVAHEEVSSSPCGPPGAGWAQGLRKERHLVLARGGVAWPDELGGPLKGLGQLWAAAGVCEQ